MNTSVLAGLESEGWKRTTGRDTVWAVVFGCPQGIPVSYRHSDLELWEDTASSSTGGSAVGDTSTCT